MNEGETVDVGTPIISIDDGVDETSPAETNDGGETQVPNLVGRAADRVSQVSPTARRRGWTGRGPRPGCGHTFSTHAPVSRRADDREPLQAGARCANRCPAARAGETAPSPTPSGGAVLAKPPVRKLAKNLGVDLASLVGSGPGGDHP